MRASALTWSVWAFAKQNDLPDALSLSSAHEQTRVQAVPQDYDPGTSGVSESQNVPFLTASKRSFR